MPIALTCDCGARFEVDDFLAGQDIACPECRHSLRAGKIEDAPPHTSILALFSLAIGLMGAFTLAGSLLAVVFGLAALWSIRRSKQPVTGANFALAGILVGLFGALFVVSLMFTRERLPVTGWLRARLLASQLDPETPEFLISRDEQCRLQRPTPDWLRARKGRTDDPAIDDLQKNVDALLVHRVRRAYLDIVKDVTNTPPQLSDQVAQIQTELHPDRLVEASDEVRRRVRTPLPEPTSALALPPVDDHNCYEWTFEVRRGGQPWRFLIRAYRDARPGRRVIPPVFLVRAYAPRRDFLALEAELRKALDSVRFAP